MNYFNASMTKEEAKKLYRKLAVSMHPDKGGNHDDFTALQNEYENFLKGNFSYSEHEAREETNSFDSFIKANEFIKTFDGVIVELTGTWIWLSGNTFPYREEIKKHGFRYSKSKKKWYKAPGELSKKKRRGTSFDKIKQRYGHEEKQFFAKNLLSA